jgi:type IV pilus assembly protein PilC
MKFKYKAKTKEGELQVGFVEAANREGAASILGTHDLFILEIEAIEAARWYDRIAGYFRRVRRSDMVIFTRQLATLLEARLPLNTALRTLYGQTANQGLRESILQVSQDVDAGLALSQALERQSEVFPPFFVSMVRSAEVTGNLDQVVGFLADYTEREALLVDKARSALIYPAIVIGLFIIVAGLMVTVVFPQIQPVFEQSGVQLPALSQALISTGVFISTWWPLLLVGAVVLILLLLDYLRTPEGMAMADDLKVRLPVLKRIYLPVTMTRFANATAMLLKGGIPVAQAIEIVGQTVDNVFYRDLLHEVAEDVRRGVAFSEAIGNRSEYFPVLVSQMLVVGETTGKLDQMLGRVATFYGREADTVANNLVELIQPILMIGVGIMVGLLFASILLPLYQLTSSLQ